MPTQMRSNMHRFRARCTAHTQIVRLRCYALRIRTGSDNYTSQSIVENCVFDLRNDRNDASQAEEHCETNNKPLPIICHAEHKHPHTNTTFALASGSDPKTFAITPFRIGFGRKFEKFFPHYSIFVARNNSARPEKMPCK